MPDLKKELSLYGLVMVAIGASIGAGIFKTPGEIASYLHTPTLTILVWILGGIVTLAGALTFAELGGLFPKAGGIYVYLREGYGDKTAFLYGWTMLVVTNTGSLAALALTFADYFSFLFPVGYYGRGFIAILAIVVVTFYNIFGAKIGEIFSNIFTGLKIIGILVLIITGIYIAFSDGSGIIQSSSKAPEDLGGAFALALVGVLFSYGGWQHTSFLSGEAKNASYTIPKAMLIGAFCVTLIYVLANLAYIYLLPIDDLAKSKAVASEAMERLFPRIGGKFIAGVIAISVFGTMGIYTLSVPRIFFAMAKDNLFFKDLAKLHPTYRTPFNAIVLQSIWAIVLIVFWGRFEDLIRYVVFIDWIFFFLAAYTIFIFRKKRSATERPYKTLGYPIVPIFFCVISAWFNIMILIKEPKQAIAGLILLLIGMPLYSFFKKQKGKLVD